MIFFDKIEITEDKDYRYGKFTYHNVMAYFFELYDDDVYRLIHKRYVGQIHTDRKRKFFHIFENNVCENAVQINDYKNCLKDLFKDADFINYLGKSNDKTILRKNDKLVSLIKEYGYDVVGSENWVKINRKIENNRKRRDDTFDDTKLFFGINDKMRFRNYYL